MPIGYVASHYPAVSHSFVLREILALRRIGVEVETVSIWRAHPDQLLTEADREAAASTFAVLPSSVPRLLVAHLRALTRRPRAYLSTLVRALRLSPPGARGRLWQLFYFAEAMVVADHCRRRRIRHLHAQFADSATDVAMLVSHYSGASCSWSMAVHGPVEFYNVDRLRLGPKVEDASFVQAISHFGRSQLMTVADEESWPKLHVVHCGVDPTVYTPNGARPGAARTELEILCVGRLVHLKGQSLLIEAAAELARRGVETRVVLIGDGPKRDSLGRLAKRLGIADRVELLGALGQDEVRRRHAAADIFCLPSFAEGLPVVLMEAMALERPVVATRIMGVPELVDDGVSGLLVSPGDLDGLVAALESLARDPARRAEIGRAARGKVLGQFDVNRSAERLSELFAGTLRSG